MTDIAPPGRSRRPRRARRAIASLLLVTAVTIVAVVPALPAAGDGASAGDVTMALSLGERELTATLRRTTSVPGPLHIDLVSHRGSPAGEVNVAIAPTGATSDVAAAPSGAVVDRGEIVIGSHPGAYHTTVTVDRPGPWELVLDDGDSPVARIPFHIPAQSTSPVELSVYGGFILAGAFLLLAAGVALRARRVGWVVLPGSVALVGVAIAVHSAHLSAIVAPPPVPGDSVAATIDTARDPYALVPLAGTSLSRPPVSLSVTTNARSGERADIVLRFADGATGRPADDLVVHGGALVHLLMASPSGTLLHHHPVRTGAGEYHVEVDIAEAGTYALSVEVARQGGGTQNVRLAGGLTVPPSESASPVAATPTPPIVSPAQREMSVLVDDTEVHVAAGGLAAGRTTTLDVVVGEHNDLQLWLGMLGHLVVAGPMAVEGPSGERVNRAAIWSHAHSMGTMSPALPRVAGGDEPPAPNGHGHDGAGLGLDGPAAAGGHGGMVMAPANGDSTPDETVAAYGPRIPFSFTFPEPGHYLVWVQFQRGFAVSTVPLQLEISYGTPERP